MSLRRDCEGCVPPHLLGIVPGGFDVIGSLAILSLPEELRPYYGAIARAIASRRKTISAIVRKTAKVSGNSRVAQFEILSGNSTITTHHEYGFSYRLDIRDAFFAPRLAAERRRVAGQVMPGETVLVPFAGVGPFAVPAAARGGHVTAVENNPAAFRWLSENVTANNVAGRMTLVNGDAYDLTLLPQREYDRAVVPAPYGQETIVDLICDVVKPGGRIHLYLFKKRDQIPSLLDGFSKNGLVARRCRRCGNVAPGVNRWVLDLEKSG